MTLSLRGSNNSFNGSSLFSSSRFGSTIDVDNGTLASAACASSSTSSSTSRFSSSASSSNGSIETLQIKKINKVSNECLYWLNQCVFFPISFTLGNACSRVNLAPALSLNSKEPFKWTQSFVLSAANDNCQTKENTSFFTGGIPKTRATSLYDSEISGARLTFQVDSPSPTHLPYNV